MKRIILLAFVLIMTMCCFTGCIKPYDKPEFVKIEASQTAFLIPLIGDTGSQGAFDSEELLLEKKVATKEIQIPHRWVQTGRRNWMGEWRPSATVIVVERKPVSRSWESGDTTVESANRAVFGETSDGIGIYVGMNCTAMIEETNAAKFLYRYNNTPLESIIDTDIKKKVEGVFNDATSQYKSTELHANKSAIMEQVKTEVIEYFKDFGITITVLDIKEGFSFENPDIQKAIDEKFASEQKLVIQQNENEANLAKAEAEAEAKVIAAQAAADAKLKEAQAQVEIAKAEAEAVRIAAEAEAEANKKIAESLTDEFLEKVKYERWNGSVPTVVGGGDSVLFTDITDMIK